MEQSDVSSQDVTKDIVARLHAMREKLDYEREELQKHISRYKNNLEDTRKLMEKAISGQTPEDKDKEFYNELKILQKKEETITDKTAFYFCNGCEARSLESLLKIITSCSIDEFSYHVNPNKNDLSLWVKNILGQNELAKELSQTTNREKTIFVIEFFLKLSKSTDW